MENYLLSILTKGGPLGAIVVIAVLLIGFALRNKGWLTSDKSKVVSNTQLSDLSVKVGAMNTRLTSLETEVRHLPTRDEFHAQDLEITRLQERLKSVDKTTIATGHAVARIEDFLINLSKRSKK